MTVSLTVWAGIAILVLANALYVAAEFGAVGVRRSRVRRMSDDGRPMARRLLPWTRVGFVIMVVTGFLLFYAIPVRSYQNIFFRVKVVLLLLAGLNAFLFHSGIFKRVASWDRAIPPPPRARFAGGASLLLWATIIFAGRMIAYNWFDCDRQPQPAWVNWAAGCVVEESATPSTSGESQP